jgi:hypothetical protein
LPRAAAKAGSAAKLARRAKQARRATPRRWRPPPQERQRLAAKPEAGEAGAVSAYAGLAGDQRTALRLQHLKGFLKAAERLADSGKPFEAGVLVSQGLLEVYDPAPAEFGALDVAVVRAAADASGLSQGQMQQRLRAADAELDRAAAGLDIDQAVVVVRMVDIATGLYQGVVQEDFVDPIEYQHSMGAAYAARDALQHARAGLRARNPRAFDEARAELERLAQLWPAPEAPERPAPYRDVLAQGSRVRLALSPFL